QAEISFQSEKNVGTTFTIRFAPAAGAVERGDALAADPPTIPAPTAATRRPLVLAVEDDDLTQGLLAVTLRGDFDLLHAASAEEARARLAAHPDIAVVLVDLSLEGDEDGLMLTRWMRSEPRWREVPIIATTAHAMPSDRQNALQAGCTAYLAKPISPAELRSAIRRLLPDG
ncbi:MAG: response regulator, partial [Deltaproteobacteria bacterium]|nr:response regulator [Deltaproteobacteria bacterium]